MRNAVDSVTHFHADHFCGVLFFVLDAQFLRRSRPLTIAGPIGLLVELRSDRVWGSHGIEVLTAPVRHGEPCGPFYAYRIWGHRMD